MTTKPSKSDPWEKVNEGKFNCAEHARELDAQNLFAPLDTPPGIGLRQFIDRETRLQAASAGSSETLAKGIYLRLTPNNEHELTVSKGRGNFICYICQTRQEALALAEELQQGR